MIINLLDNAIKFTPSGGQISVTAEPHIDHVAISINDTGSGIPLEQRPHIFERFARGSSEGPRPRGFGLGLTFCRSGSKTATVAWAASASSHCRWEQGRRKSKHKTHPEFNLRGVSCFIFCD